MAKAKTRVPSDLSEKETREARKAIEGGEGFADMARKLSINPRSLKSWYYRNYGTVEQQQHYSAVAKAKYTIKSLSTDFTDEEAAKQVLHDREVAGLKAQRTRYQKLYNAAIKGRAFEEEILGNLATSIQALDVMAPQPITIPKGKKASGLHASIAHLSDLHNGEVVDIESMGGLGEFNMEIFRWRLGYYVRKFLRLLELKRSQLEIPTWHVFAGGDWISGLIHDELLKTNQTNVLDQVVTTAYWMSHAIAQISVHFEEVYFHGVVGNHGRTQQKIEHKETHVNWDHICYQMVAFFLKDYTHIKFDLPKSLWQVVDVVNTKWLHAHGHGIKGWAGIPYYGINRFLQEMRETLALGDIQYDSVALCHFHEAFTRWIPTGQLIINGNWKGGDEYALNGLHKTTDPIQIVSTVHEKYGPLAPEPIYLKWAEESDGDIIPERVPGIWAEGAISREMY